MKLLLLTVVVAYSVTSAIAAPSGGVSPAKVRIAALERAERLLKPSVTKESFPAAVNPFTLNGSRSTGASGDESQAVALASVMANNKSLLSALVDQLEPKGTFVVGGEAIILIGQKKLKVSEKLPISFEGAIYELEITSIEATRFSVKFRNEEITRPIVITKPAK